MENIIEKLNNIIKNAIEKYETKICTKISNKKKNKRKYSIKNKRKNGIDIKNVLEYCFLYSNINYTQETATSETNINNNVSHSRSSYERHFKKINVEFLKDIYSNILKLFYDESKNYTDIINVLNDDKLKILSEQLTVKPLDGVCSEYIKDNKLCTEQDVYLFNSNFNIPLILMDNKNITIFDNNKNNKSNKNSETLIANNYFNNLNDNEEKYKDIYIGDRLYSSYNVIKNIIKKQQYFIIRAKDNMDIFNDEIKSKIKDKIKKNTKKNIKKNTKNENKNSIIIDDNIRTIKYTVTSTNILKNKKNNKELNFTLNKEFYLITNLPKDYSDDIIKTMYQFRWNIEVFYKHLKNNFKYDIFYNEDKNTIEKLKYVEMIIYTLNRLLILISLNEKYKENNNIFNNAVKIRSSVLEKKDMRLKKNKIAYDEYLKNNSYICSIRVNISHSIIGFYKLILNKFINGNLSETDINKYNKNYVKIQRNKLNRNFCRTSISPFSKWYIKNYSRLNEFKKIIKAIENDKIDSLNKNLKLKAKELSEQIQNTKILNKIKELLF
jgi:hypothetical protein